MAVALANPAGLLLLSLAIPIVVLHILRPRRESVDVSSTFLWRALARPVSSARPWQRLRPNLLLLLQLLVVVGLALAAARPVKVADTVLAEHTVFIVDASGSMAAADGDPDRLAEAIDEARRLRGELPSGGVASLVVAGSEPRALLTASSDERAFRNALSTVEVTAGSADFAGAFHLAAGLETVDSDIAFVLLSDGGLSDAEQQLLPPGTTYRQVGSQSTNRAITQLAVEPHGAGLYAIVGLANTGGPAATQDLRLDVDGVTVWEDTIRLDEGEEREVAAELPAGERVEAFLEGEDLLPVDNHAYAVAPSRQEVNVTVVGATAEPDPILDVLFQALGDAVTPTWLAEEDWDEAAEAAETTDVVVYNLVPVPDEPALPFLAIAPPRGAPGVEVTGPVEQPIPTYVLAGDPLLVGLDLSNPEIVFTEAQVARATTAEVLVASEETALLLRGRAGSVPYVYAAFDPLTTTLVADMTFPILFDRILVELGGAAIPPLTMEAGSTLPVDPTRETSVRSPLGQEREVAPGTRVPRADRPGFWELEREGQPPRTVAVNPSPSESGLRPATSLLAPERTARPGEEQPQAQASLLGWLVVPLLLLVAVEWLLVRRSSGVSRRQFRAATGLRVLVVLALVAALLDLGLVRKANHVATVFVVDASDSLGPAGQAQAVDWVREALASMPDGDRAGVVLFGGDARLERTVRSDASLGDPVVRIDPTRTDLAQALRLGAAVLPSDARRRLVLVSDGRATHGDAADEADRLAQSGIPVDVHLVAPRSGPDAAVADIQAPSRAQVGDTVPITVTISATAAIPAQVELIVDGEVLQERTVDLDPGETTVDLRVPSVSEGVVRFQVRVSAAGDTVSENDVGYGAVLVEGSGRVLLLEDRDGGGDGVVEALREGGMTVDVARASSLPPLDELATYQSVVLADVPAGSLSSDQVATLGAAVRDLGTGLVTVGGTRSYGLGGYLGTELEQLLPVVSDILDPERRQTVAQVLAIDTSGSMGACHCSAGGGMEDRSRGGVVKTDIARAGAARAIDALTASDQVGILAVDTEERWLVPLQDLPSEDVVTSGLQEVHPRETEGTDLSRTLSEAADSLRRSGSSLKHIILFTDGFVSGDEAVLGRMADEAEALTEEEGITVSVIATGEMDQGSEGLLEAVADSGGGRFYPGRDLHEIPQLMQEETVMASRELVQEGEFLPSVTSNAAVVSDLVESPPLFGFIGTTARPEATTHLRLGPYSDPLLASWNVGLGRVTSWTSDSGERWGQAWSGWEGFAGFWADVVRDTFPVRMEGVTARVENGMLTVEVEGEDSFPAGAEAGALVVGPDLATTDLRLERVTGNRFAGELPVSEAGSYSVAATILAGGDDALAQGTALASLSHTPEYLPGEADLALLQRVSELTGGRGQIEAAQVFDPEALRPGRSRLPLATWLLVAAALAWPVAVALSRLALRGAVTRQVRFAGATAAWWAGRLVRRLPALPGRDGRQRARPRPERPAPSATAQEEKRAERSAAEAPAEALGSLLAAQRRRRSGEADTGTAAVDAADPPDD